MNWLSAVFGFLGGNTVGKALDIALEKTEDVDKRNALVMGFAQMKEETHRQSIARVTIPWVDALHKMGRLIMIVTGMVGIFVLIGTGHAQELKDNAEFIFTAFGLGGIYTLQKGRGQ